MEQRFGPWARLGVILYAVCLPFETMSELPAGLYHCYGVLVASYPVAGGLEAVIWTDFLQVLALLGGGLICLPIAVGLLPGGLTQIFSEALADGKFSVGSTAFTWSEQTVWILMLLYLFLFLGFMCTDQMTVQRYLSMRTDKEARKGLMVGAFLTVPVWVYFSFIGTALYVVYKTFPRAELGQIVPEQILPYFILTEVPAGPP